MAERDKESATLTDAERAAVKERTKELKTEARRKSGRSTSNGEADVLAKIAEMPKRDREMAERVHAIVKENAPDLTPRTWYGMPAYAKDGQILCYFQSAKQFDARYATFGFNEAANLDDGAMWPTSYALTELTATEEKTIAELIRQAVS